MVLNQHQSLSVLQGWQRNIPAAAGTCGANQIVTCPSARFREVTHPWDMPPAHLVGMISLDVPEGAGGRLAQGAAGQGGLQHRLLHQQRLRLCQGLLVDDDGGGRGRGAGSSGRLRRRLFLHLHFGVVEILLPLPLVGVCAVPAREEKETAVKRRPCFCQGEQPPTSLSESDLTLPGRAAPLPGSKASRQLQSATATASVAALRASKEDQYLFQGL